MIESLGYKGFYNGKVTIENFIDYLLKNKKFVEAIAKELLKKKYLTAREILEIESRHPLR